MTNLLRYGKVALVLTMLSLPLASLAQTPKITVNAVFPPLSYLPYPGTHSASEFLKYVASSPLVDGINPPLLWSMVDMGPDNSGGQYNWSKFDAVIQPYINLGKTVNLIVWPISEAGPNSENYANHATPTYVMDLVDSVTCDKYPGDGTKAGRYPIVWETAFKQNYQNFIAEVLTHYKGNPHIGYIRFGLAPGAAIYPNCEGQQTNYLPAGQTFEQTLLDFDSEMVSYEKSQNPAFPIIAPMVVYQTHLAYATTEAANGIANGFGLGYQGLRSSDIATYPDCTSDWCGIYAKYSTAEPPRLFELQTVGQSDPSATCTPSCWDGVQQQTGPLPPLLSFAVENNVNTFEVYADDLLLALDPMYPGYNEYHIQYEHALQAVHTGIGSSVTLSHTSLEFEEYVGSTSTPETIAVINSGSSDLTVHSVSVVGDFSQTNDCVGKKLKSGEQCTISVLFTPTTAGKIGGLLTIADTDPWTPQTVGLNGSGK